MFVPFGTVGTGTCFGISVGFGASLAGSLMTSCFGFSATVATAAFPMNQTCLGAHAPAFSVAFPVEVPTHAGDLHGDARRDAHGDCLGDCLGDLVRRSVSLCSTRGDLDQRSSRGPSLGDLDWCHDLYMYLGGDGERRRGDRVRSPVASMLVPFVMWRRRGHVGGFRRRQIQVHVHTFFGLVLFRSLLFHMPLAFPTFSPTALDIVARAR